MFFCLLLKVGLLYFFTSSVAVLGYATTSLIFVITCQNVYQFAYILKDTDVLLKTSYSSLILSASYAPILRSTKILAFYWPINFLLVASDWIIFWRFFFFIQFPQLLALYSDLRWHRWFSAVFDTACRDILVCIHWLYDISLHSSGIVFWYFWIWFIYTCSSCFANKIF